MQSYCFDGGGNGAASEMVEVGEFEDNDVRRRYNQGVHNLHVQCIDCSALYDEATLCHHLRNLHFAAAATE